MDDMVEAFADEDQCRRLVAAMVWPRGRICPACGFRKSVALAGRDVGRKARPGLYQCSNGECRFQFTVTTRTPLHSTKLPLRVWLTGLWLIRQSDKGLSSVRLAEAIGVSQPTAWRMGHALRLLVTREQPVAGTVEIDDVYVGGSPRKDPDRPRLGRGRKGQPRTTKTPALSIVQRPDNLADDTQAGAAGAHVADDLSEREAFRVLSEHVAPSAHLMSDEWKSFMSAGQAFAAHDTVKHCDREYARGPVHINSAAAGLSALSPATLHAGHEEEERSSDRAGPGLNPLRSSPPCSSRQSGASSAAPSPEESKSAAPWLCLVMVWPAPFPSE